MDMVTILRKTLFEEDFLQLEKLGLWDKDKQIVVLFGDDYSKVTEPIGLAFSFYNHPNFIVILGFQSRIYYVSLLKSFVKYNHKILCIEEGFKIWDFVKFLEEIDDLDTIDSFKLKLTFFNEKYKTNIRVSREIK